MSGRGVCYVVWGDDSRRGYAWHVQAAARAAGYARRQGLATALLAEAEPPAGLFDRFVPAPEGWAGAGGFYRKWLGLTLTPFEHTLLTDTDLLVTGDVSLAWAAVERFGLAATYAPGQVLQWAGREYPHFQGGFLGFAGRRPDLLAAIDAARLELGAAEYDDEAALSLALWREERPPFVLPSVFNVVVSGYVHPRPIRGWHSPLPPQSHLVSVLDNPNDRVEV